MAVRLSEQRQCIADIKRDFAGGNHERARARALELLEWPGGLPAIDKAAPLEILGALLDVEGNLTRAGL